MKTTQVVSRDGKLAWPTTGRSFPPVHGNQKLRAKNQRAREAKLERAARNREMYSTSLVFSERGVA
jgi:hypothetical protein